MFKCCKLMRCDAAAAGRSEDKRQELLYLVLALLAAPLPHWTRDLET